MNNVIKFVSRKTNTLWAPTSKTKLNWRFGSTPMVVPFRNIELERQTKYELERDMEQKKREQERLAKNAAIDAISDVRRAELDDLVEKINAYEPDEQRLYDLYADYLNDSVPSDLNNLMRESYQPDFEDFVTDAKNKGWTDDDVRQKLIDCADVSYGTMWNESNTIASIGVGEYEDQIDELGLEDLVGAERDYVSRHVNCYMPDKGNLVYWNTDAFFRLVVDCDKLPKRIKNKRA